MAPRATQALVAVRVCDVAADGASTLITRGVLNLTHRDGHQRPELLEPDRRYRVRFPLHAIGYSIPEGHRVRVAIAPTCWPIVWPSPEPVRLTVFLPGSHIHFPVLTGDADTRFPFPEPVQARQFPHTTVDESEQGSITRNLVTGEVTAVYESGEGYQREELGEDMRYHSHERDTFHIVDEDPNSATVRSERRIQLSRADWHTTVVAQGEMTCDKDAYYVDTELTTFVGDQQIFHKRWRFAAPRDMT
ncbi:CocE/NonD family hydrolase C-terminal non-catalytic domain-containing protein [Pseudonocardia sp.]|uniref:CocE/NonD family hydrolase C-terminal non-catalytic domain-containing protein n=1 Tax=Pseudonocardia sp. TaxID=60912 RepID=UPI0039C8D7F8